MGFTFSFSTDTFISFIALLLTIGSYGYTWYLNRYSLTVSNSYKSTIRKQKFIEFTIINTSPKSICIKDIQLYLNNNKIIDTGFDPVANDEEIRKMKYENWEKNNSISILGSQISPGMNPYLLTNDFSAYQASSNNFQNEVFLLPSESVSFSYYVNKIPDKLLVKTDKKINCFKKEHLFLIHFYERN